MDERALSRRVRVPKPLFVRAGESLVLLSENRYDAEVAGLHRPAHAPPPDDVRGVRRGRRDGRRGGSLLPSPCRDRLRRAASG